MIDILVYLFENYADLSLHADADALTRKLNAAGFEKVDISEALGWLAGLKSARMAEWPGNRRSLRVFTEEEQQKLGADCQGLLHSLEAGEIITPGLRELVIERGLMLDDWPLPLAKFKIIVLMVLWSRGQDLGPLLVEELLYGSNPELPH